MSYHVIRVTNPTAKKQHRCIWCGEIINVGEKYQREVSSFYKELQNHSWHNECLADMQEAATYEGYDYEFLPYSNERPERVA